jgi:hypothetical protein
MSRIQAESAGTLLARIGTVEVRAHGAYLTWTSGLAVDADGAPRAYHPESRKGLDALANAGKPGNWWGVACDARGIPFVQGPNEPAPGFHVSTTALQDSRFPVHSCKRYVDAETIPYIVLPRGMPGGARLGDFAVVMNLETGARCGAIWADIGPRGKLGEGSIALAKALGIDSAPRTGGCRAGILTVLFPGSGNRRVQVAEFIRERTTELLARHGIRDFSRFA